MCGIIGMIANRPVAGHIVDALKRLEYRGYDSAGVATLDGGPAERRRAEGKLFNLEKGIDESPLGGAIGIGHTRWATHGAPTANNAHPHRAGRVSIVHNGIIENFQELAAELAASGIVPESETDTEIVALFFNKLLEDGLAPEAAMEKVAERVTGAYALVLMIDGEEDLLLCARRASPLAIGYGEGEMFIGSDALALAPFTRKISYLEDGDWALIRRSGAEIRDETGAKVERPIKLTEATGALIGKGNYRHFMEKEIHEQPEVMGYTLFHYYRSADRSIALPDLPFDPASLPKLTIVAAGTSFYAGMVAKYWFETLARIPVEIDIASEFRYRNPVMPEGGAALFISQSGESLDTLMALRHARDGGQHIVALVNQPESTIARESDVVLETLAGPEICVASTKAFTTQLVALLTLAVDFARRRGSASKEQLDAVMDSLVHLPAQIGEVLKETEKWLPVSHELSKVRDVLYLGRGLSYPIAMEGALKLKELSYIHAEGYAAGEMKHGPIALLEEGVPVIMVAPMDPWFEKVASNAMEVRARGGRVILLSDRSGINRLGDLATWSFELPECDPMVAPILYTIPVQLLSYFTAAEKGTDVDQPRNLAKSVTVE
ncbi:glutamine--fructose-6-phosphate transaminase (isomerizing) [Nisaea acidiphila]|uniref:Glutamine--fructose-6-phosphate aminotransferase [isomerizing] n=1 Tax=Nisaea acidiphila TaxID=1862145 RepID=A0A9J7APS9_9PROT|nr:glutamine--fructose-6-phosphate transaminase (isomerizing) [Nisaea acidiphila]UUX49619.1 glutamine--fructose-6-phosphate transaminase (isomerizing) [Nisaea acidiphila]